MTEPFTPYEDALLYMENAKQTLKKAKKTDGQYRRVKYVKIASGTAYSAVLLALDEYLLQQEGDEFKKPKGVKGYRKRIAKIDKKVLSWLNVVYDTLHLAGYYHGTTSCKTIKIGFEEAEKIIQLIK